MHLVISLSNSPDLRDPAVRTQNLFREAIDNSYKEVDYQSTINTLLIFLILLNPGAGVLSNFLSRKRSENALWVGINIDYDKWIISPGPEKVDLFTIAILNGIAMTSDKHIPKDIKAKLTFYVSGIALEIREKFEREQLR